MIAVPAMLIARQPDLGTALIIAASGLIVLFLAGISWRYVFSVLGLALVVRACFVVFVEGLPTAANPDPA